jgi:hypothetical protein
VYSLLSQFPPAAENPFHDGIDFPQGIDSVESTPVPEFIDPVFTKTSPKRSFSLNRKRAFWLVVAKTGSLISGTGSLKVKSSGTRAQIITCVLSLRSPL